MVTAHIFVKHLSFCSGPENNDQSIKSQYTVPFLIDRSLIVFILLYGLEFLCSGSGA